MKRGVFIEIAALVDVLLVILFLVMLQVTETAEAAQAAKAEAAATKVADTSVCAAQISALRAENSELSRKLGTYTVFEKNCLIVTISVEYGEGSRTILVESGGNTARIALTWNNTQYAGNSLKAELGGRIRDAFKAGDQMAFIVFQYDRDTIYQSDYSLVSSAVQSQKTYSDVYSAEYDILGAKPYGK
jgi:hypothetical protein